MLLNCGVEGDSWESLGLQRDQRVHPKGNQSWIVVGRTDAEAEAPIIWPADEKNCLIGKDPDTGKDWRQEKKGMTEDELVGWQNQLNGHEFEQALRDGEEKGSLACSIHGVSKSWTDWVTEQQQCQLHLNLTKVTWFCFLVPKYKKEYSWLID